MDHVLGDIILSYLECFQYFAVIDAWDRMALHASDVVLIVDLRDVEPNLGAGFDHAPDVLDRVAPPPAPFVAQEVTDQRVPVSPYRDVFVRRFVPQYLGHPLREPNILLREVVISTRPPPPGIASPLPRPVSAGPVTRKFEF